MWGDLPKGYSISAILSVELQTERSGNLTEQAIREGERA